MVAYSFQRCFRTPIRVGLGLEPERPEPGAPRPKRQTIRAIGKRRHARPGDDVQLYVAMRTKFCELLGVAVCVDAIPIQILFPTPQRKANAVVIAGGPITLHRPPELDGFAMDDGFATWADLREFWSRHHPGVTDFSGVLILWEPKETA